MAISISEFHCHFFSDRRYCFRMFDCDFHSDSKGAFVKWFLLDETLEYTNFYKQNDAKQYKYWLWVLVCKGY